MSSDRIWITGFVPTHFRWKKRKSMLIEFILQILFCFHSFTYFSIGLGGLHPDKDWKCRCRVWRPYVREETLISLTFFTQAKVSNFHKAICIHQKVIQLQVPWKRKEKNSKLCNETGKRKSGEICNKNDSQFDLILITFVLWKGSGRA